MPPCVPGARYPAVPIGRRSFRGIVQLKCISHLRFYLRTSLIFSLHPTASAYLRRAAMDGECRLLPPPASIRATIGLEVPMRLGTSSWVSPASFLAFYDSSRSSNSVSRASYSALTSASSSILLTVSSWVSIGSYLLHPPFGNSGFTGRWLPSLFHETVEHYGLGQIFN